ncbi:MAG: hypothetical protein QOJ49_1749 [Actinomycetota bacterium]|nr:hypothetical protein [Actinomycetota bacterium]
MPAMPLVVRRLPKPSPAFVVAVIALVVAMAGTAVAATGQLVNITDPNNAAQIAKVDTSGRLQTVTAVAGTAQANEAIPANFFNAVSSVSTVPGCVGLYKPPAGKAAVLLNVQGNVTIARPGGTILRFWVAPDASPCFGGPRLFLTAGETVGTLQQSLEAGWGIPSGYTLYADQYSLGGSADEWIVSAQGFVTTSSAVPAAAAAVSGSLSKLRGAAAPR